MKINRSLVRGGRKIISVALCLVMMFTTFFIFEPSVLSELLPKASAADWNYSYITSSRDGLASGISSAGTNAININNADGFAYFISNYTKYNGYTVNLQCDVFMQKSQSDLEGITYDYTEGSPAAWYGVLNGNGHCISNYRYYWKNTSSKGPKGNYNGFGIIKKMSGGVVKDLTVLNTYIYGFRKRGYDMGQAGGLIGSISNDSSGSYSDVKIENVTVDKPYVNLAGGNGDAERSYEYGGIVGYIEKKTTFTNCKVTSAKIQLENGGVRQGGFIGKSTAEVIIQNDTPTVSVDSSSVIFVDGWNDTDHGGLIGWTSGNTTIKNVIVEGTVYSGDTCGGMIGYSNGNVSIIDSTAKGTVRGKQYGAGFVGFADSADGKSNTVSFNNCKNYAFINSRSDNAGGFVGKNVSSISFTDCENRGVVTTNGSSTAGGFIGWQNNDSRSVSFLRSNNYGSVTAGNYGGGFIGADVGTAALSFNDAHNYGSVKGADRTGGFLGGTNRRVTFTNCTNENSVTGTGSFAGGFIGLADSSNALSFTNCTNTGSISTGGTDAGGMFGKTTGYVTTISNCHNKGTITSSGTSAGGMFGYTKGNGRGSTVMRITNCTNISAIESTGNNAVGGMVGSSDMPVNVSGCSNSATITGGQYVGGLVGVCNNGTITISDSNNTGSISARGGLTGGIIGDAKPTESAGITIKNCKNTASSFTANGENIGGIIGKNESNYTLTVENCHNTSTLKITANYVGGLVGTNNGKIAMNNCTNKANITGKQYTGGLIAWIEDDGGEITNCLNTGDVSGSGNSNVGGILATIKAQANNPTWTFKNLVNTGTIYGASATGGILGYMGNTDDPGKIVMTDCINKGKIDVTGNDAGGIVGNIYNHGSTTLRHTYTNLYNYGDVSSSSTGDTFIGGIVGKEYGFSDFTNCVNYGDITETATSGNNIAGGIVGWIQDDASTVKGCINYGQISGRNNVGGIVGEFSGSSTLTITQCGNYGTLVAKNAGNTQIGGIMGRFNGSTIYMSKCFNGNGTDGTIADSSSKGLYAGGLIGYGNTIYIADSYNNAPAVYGNTSGGLVGWCNSSVYLYNSYNKTTKGVTTQYSGNKTATAYGCYTSSISTGTSSLATLNTGRSVPGIGSAGNAYVYKAGINQNYPVLLWQVNTLTKNVGRNLIADLIADTANSGFTASGSSYTIKLDGVTKTYYTTYTKTVNGVTVTYSTLDDTLTLNGTPTAMGSFDILSMDNPNAVKTVYRSSYYIGGYALNSAVRLQNVDISRETSKHESTATNRVILVMYVNQAVSKFDNYKVHASLDYVNNVTATSDSLVDLHSTYSDLGTPTKKGYNFLGWYNQRSNGTKITDGSTIVNSGTPSFSDTLDREFDIYAHWDPITYTIVYNGNGATSGDKASSSHTYDEAKNLTANGFKREFTVTFDYNYSGSISTEATASSEFNGWATSADGDKVYDNKQSVLNLTEKDKDTIDLYANWTDVAVKFPTPTRTGYNFSGWYNAAGNKVEETTVISEDLVLHAEWSIKSYTVIFKNGSEELQNSKWEYNTVPKYNGATPTKPSDDSYEYTFSKWSPEITAVTGDTTYTAQFDAKGHEYKCVMIDKNQHKYVCSNCGYEKAPENHKLAYVKTDNGYSYSCTECEYSYTTTAKAYAVDFSCDSYSAATNAYIKSECEKFAAANPPVYNEAKSKNYYIAAIKAPLTITENGQKLYFAYWKDADTNEVVGTYTTYRYFQTKDCKFTPVYETQQNYYTTRDKAVIASRVVDFRPNDDGSYSLLAEHSVASSCKSIKGHGVIYTTDSSAIDSLVYGSDNENVTIKAATTSNSALTGLFEVIVKPQGAGKIWVRTYVIDANNVVHYGATIVESNGTFNNGVTMSFDVTANTASAGEEVITLGSAGYDLTDVNTESDITFDEEKPTEKSPLEIFKTIIEKLVSIINEIISYFTKAGARI